MYQNPYCCNVIGGSTSNMRNYHHEQMRFLLSLLRRAEQMCQMNKSIKSVFPTHSGFFSFSSSKSCHSHKPGLLRPKLLFSIIRRRPLDGRSEILLFWLAFADCGCNRFWSPCWTITWSIFLCFWKCEIRVLVWWVGGCSKIGGKERKTETKHT